MFIKISGPLSENIIQLKKNKTKIGLDSENDIVLMGSLIGEFHCEVLFKNDDFFIKHLDSEESTSLNGNVLSPNVIYAFNLNDKLKIGEFSLSLSEVDSSSSEIDESFDDSVNEYAGLSDDELLAQIDNVYAKSNKVKKSSYKIGSHLELTKDEVEVPATQIPVQESYRKAQPRREGTKSTGAVKRKRRGGKKKEGSFSLQLVFYISLATVFTGFIYYTKYYKPSFESNAKLTKKIKRSEVILSGLYKSEMAKHKKVFDLFFSSKKCDGNIADEICRLYWTGSLHKNEGALLIGDSLVIGKKVSNLEKESVSLTENLSLSDAELEEIIEKQYSMYFSFEEFVGNQYKPTTQLHRTRGSTYNRIHLLYQSLVNSNLEKLTKHPFQNILYFTFSEASNNIFIEDFIYLMDYQKRLENLQQDDFNQDSIALYYKYELTDGVEKFYKTRISTHISEYDPNLYRIYQLNKLKETLSNLDNDNNCMDESTAELCKQFKEVFSNQSGPIITQNKKLYIGMNFDDFKKYLENFPKDYRYSNVEYSSLIRTLRKFNPNVDSKELIANNYVYQATDSEIISTMFFYILLKLDHLHNKDLVSLFDNVFIYFYKQQDSNKKLLANFDLNLNKVSKIKKQVYTSKINYLTRSYIPIFKYEAESIANITMFEETE